MPKIKKKVPKNKRRRSFKPNSKGLKPMSKKVSQAIKLGTYPEPKRKFLSIDWNDPYYKTGVGRPKRFETPAILARHVEAYFNYVLDNPWITKEWKSSGAKYGAGVEDIPLTRPFTLGGLSSYLGVTPEFFHMFKAQLRKDDPFYNGFMKVLEDVDNIIRTQKFEGATVGVFNSNIIAYDLGLKKDMPMVVGGNMITLNISIVDATHEKLLNEVKRQLEAIDIEHEELILDVKQLKSNGKH